MADFFKGLANRITTADQAAKEMIPDPKMPPQCGPQVLGVKRRMVSVNARLPMARITNRPPRGPVKSEVKAEKKRLEARARHPIERVDLPDGIMWGAQIFLQHNAAVHLGYFQTKRAAIQCYERALKAHKEGSLGQFLEFIGKQRKIGVDSTQIGPPRKKRRYVRQVESKHQKWKREREEGNKRLAEKLAKKRLEILSKRKTIGSLSSPKFEPQSRSSNESMPPLDIKSEFSAPGDISPTENPVKRENPRDVLPLSNQNTNSTPVRKQPIDLPNLELVDLPNLEHVG